MKHIAIIGEHYPTTKDPVHPFTEELAHSLAKEGVNITVIAPQSVIKWLKNRKAKHPKHEVITYGNSMLTILQPYCISFSNYTPRINFWSRRRAVEKSIKRLTFKPDVYLGEFWHSGYLPYRIATKDSTPIIVQSGESVISFKADTEDKKQFCKYVSGVICVSTKNKNESVEKALTTAEKCIVLPNAIDNAIFRKLDKKECRNTLNLKAEDFVVAFVGWFSERKGSVRVSDAIQKLNNDKIKSIFIGTGPDELAPKCDNIVFKGRVPHHEISKYLNAADVFVLPTLHEGCCNAIIEAMACGLPIISSDLPFNHDVLNDNNSIMLDPNDVDAIAAAIERLYNDRVLVTSLSEGALAKAKELTLEQRAERIVAYIRGMINC